MSFQSFPKVVTRKPHGWSFSMKAEMCQALIDFPLFSVLKLSQILIVFAPMEVMRAVNSAYLESFQIASWQFYKLILLRTQFQCSYSTLMQVQATKDLALTQATLLWLCSTHGEKNQFSGLEIILFQSFPRWVSVHAPQSSCTWSGNSGDEWYYDKKRRSENIKMTFSLLLHLKHLIHSCHLDT